MDNDNSACKSAINKKLLDVFNSLSDYIISTAECTKSDESLPAAVHELINLSRELKESMK